jgi:hypothetical protein
MSDETLQRAIDAGGGPVGGRPRVRADFSVPAPLACPYTEETLDLAEGAVAKACGGRDDDRTAARYVLDALSEAGLLARPVVPLHRHHLFPPQEEP